MFVVEVSTGYPYLVLWTLRSSEKLPKEIFFVLLR